MLIVSAATILDMPNLPTIDKSWKSSTYEAVDDLHSAMNSCVALQKTSRSNRLKSHHMGSLFDCMCRFTGWPIFTRLLHIIVFPPVALSFRNASVWACSVPRHAKNYGQMWLLLNLPSGASQQNSNFVFTYITSGSMWHSRLEGATSKQVVPDSSSPYPYHEA